MGSPAATLRRALAQPPDRAALWVAEQRFPQGTSNYHIPRRVLDMARRNRNPIRTRLLLFWENHFTHVDPQGRCRNRSGRSTFSFQEVDQRPTSAQLLRTSAHSPAMMRYLDNTRRASSGASTRTTPARSWNCTLSAWPGATPRRTSRPSVGC